MEHRARVGVECPQCHWRHLLEVHLEETLLDSPYAAEIQQHLQAWLASRCPEHLGGFLKASRN